MANFEVPENPEFTQELRKLLSTDLAHADTFNPLFQALLNNTVNLFKKIGNMAKVATSGSYIDLLDKPDIPTVPSSLKNPYKWKANGKVYDGSSEQDMGTLGLKYGGTGATTAADARTNLGLGTAATYKVANNDTTTAEGYLADARIVRQHGIEIDEINSDLSDMSSSLSELLKVKTITKSALEIEANSNASYTIPMTTDIVENYKYSILAAINIRAIGSYATPVVQQSYFIGGELWVYVFNQTSQKQKISLELQLLLLKN